MARWMKVAASAALTMALASAAPAQTYPSQQITIIVPYSPGNGLDVLARRIADGLREQLSTPVIVENRPGAAGALGTAAAARAAPDGYTLLFTAHPPFATAPYAMERPLYDPLKNFEPIIRVATGPMILVTASSSPATSFKALTDYARAHPEKANYASAGLGSPGHLLGELLNRAAGLKLQQVAYRATEQGLTDVIAGNVLVSFVSVAAATPHIEAGTIRPLAVGSRERLPERPDVPTLAEALGRPGLEASVWYGLLAPSGLPGDVTARLDGEVSKLMRSGRLDEFMKRLNLYPQIQGPAEFRASLVKDVEFAKEIVAGTKN